MAQLEVTRDHWLNTVVGLIDASFYLSPEEQYASTKIITGLLDRLNIPDRGQPLVIPMPVVQEMHANYYSTALDTVNSGLPRQTRFVNNQDCVTSLEAWRSALEGMILQAYPDLSGDQRLLLAKVLNDWLAAVGIPNRAASFLPAQVLRAHRDLDDN